ncbi:hypothetical protein CV019_00095, partial [Staphylococcus haemolyticus]
LGLGRVRGQTWTQDSEQRTQHERAGGEMRHPADGGVARHLDDVGEQLRKRDGPMAEQHVGGFDDRDRQSGRETGDQTLLYA